MKTTRDAQILCSSCNSKTQEKIHINKGYKLRFHECINCKEKYYNPLDLKQFKEFQNIRNKRFQVKLRMVGNSFSVTIPREIIEFEERFAQIEKEVNQMLRLHLEEPGKVSLRFREL